MQKLQDSVFSIVKTTNLSSAVFSFLQPSEDYTDKTPLGGILNDTKHGWLALGPKFCVVDLRTGLKVAAHTFGSPQSTANTSITCVTELPRPLTPNSIQLVISLQSDDSGMICILHVSGSQLLRCIQTEVIVTEMAICDRVPGGPFTCFDGVVMVGTKSGEIFAFDLNREGLIQALKDISQGYDNLVPKESNPVNLTFLHFNALNRIQEQREIALENEDHLAVLLNENSLVDNQYIFRNPDGSVRMKAKRDHIRVTVLQYIPQLGSLAVGYNFGAFQIWNIMSLELEFTSQVNVECLPVTQFGFQEPCDDPRAFCYLWVVFSVIDRFEEEEFPLAVMYSLTYQGKRMLSDTKVLYQEFSMATLRFQLELSSPEDVALLGGKCVSCHTYSVNSTLAAEGEDSMLNICQIVWECWGENAKSSMQYGMLLFDLDQWYKDQMPAHWRLESNAFMSVTWCSSLWGDTVTLDVRLDVRSLALYSHATRNEEHFYPNSLQYNCICLNTSESCVLHTSGIQRQIITSLDSVGATALLSPTRLYHACVAAGLTPLYVHHCSTNVSQEEQRKFLLSVALEAKLSRLLKKCAHDWATGSHAGVGCTLTFLVDWCWSRAIELKENAKELTAPLFASSALPDRNVIRCLEHCVQQLTQLTSLLDSILTKCCNLIVPDALSEIEEKYKGIGTVSLYFQVVQWFLRVGLLPERQDNYNALPYPMQQLYATYTKRRLKLNRIQDNTPTEESDKPCPLLYIDQLIEHEFDGERIRELWQKGGSECSGLYPPPSLYSLLRLYLLPDVSDEHKHSLVLYLLVDYSMVYDEVRYESVIRRLMQFPTMFGLSNTAIKATQAFWHLDHRDFDFALDQLQCLTGNTLSDWQHNVVLSTLLAQNKTQSALQYLHVRKPAPIQMKNNKNLDISNISNNSRVNDIDKLDDWRSCCNLYLARGLVFQALDVIRMCVQNAGSLDDKVEVLKFFFRGCRHTGNLPKVLQLTLSQLEEEVFVKYLEECNESHTSDILVMYYLQQSRYVEAERYNNKLKQHKPRTDISTSIESLFDDDRESARDAIVEVVCSSLPSIASKVAKYALDEKEIEPHVIVPKPMSVYVKAKSPKNTFTYKSSFIQDTIENASETWMNKPKMRRGLKRALNVEDTPFICTPKLNRSRSISLQQKSSESTPPKRPRLDLTGTPKTPRSCVKVSEQLKKEMNVLLNMPDVMSPDKLYQRSGAETPHSILKIRRTEALDRDAPSPVDSRYLEESDDELLETASNHTHYSDSTNKHLRFTIPTASESGSTPSPLPAHSYTALAGERETELDVSTDTYTTTASHPITEKHPLESPPKKLATEETISSRKSFKDTVRARRSLSISVNSSLSDDPNTSIESIADIPITLINPRYSGEKYKQEKSENTTKLGEKYRSEQSIENISNVGEKYEQNESVDTTMNVTIEVPKTPKGRRSIRAVSESTPLVNRKSVTPERQDSPTVTPTRGRRSTRSRSRTPDLSPRSSPLAPILELPKQEIESEAHPVQNTLVVRQLRSKSRTPERKDKIIESPRLEAITESPTKSSESSSESPTRRSLRSRSRTPEVEIQEPSAPTSPRTLRRRAKTPEKIMSPKIEHSARSKKPLSRLVLEHNTFAKTKLLGMTETDNEPSEKPENIECTPMKAIKQVPSLMDVTLSPITNKSILPSSADTTISETSQEIKTSKTEITKNPFTTIHETFVEKSVLHSYQSSGECSKFEEKIIKTDINMKSLPAFTLNESEFNKSVLQSYESSIADSSSIENLENVQDNTNISKPFSAFVEMIQSDFDKSVLHSAQSSVVESSLITDDSKQQEVSSLITNDSDVEMQEKTDQDTAEKIEKEKIVEIEREINELEGDMSDSLDEQNSSDGESSDDEENEEENEEEEEEVEEEEVQEEDNESGSDESSSSSSNEDVVINIDSDTDEEEDRLQIVEEPENLDNNKVTETTDQPNNDNIEVTKEVEIENVEIIAQGEDEVESSVDPLNQGQISLLTDDNTADSDKSDLKLDYSDENIDIYGDLEIPMETGETVTDSGPTETNLPKNVVENPPTVEAPKESKEENIKTPVETTLKEEVKMDTETTEMKTVQTEDVVVTQEETKTPAILKDSEPVETITKPKEQEIEANKDEPKVETTEHKKLDEPEDKPIENTAEKSDEKTDIKPARRTRGRSNSSNISEEIRTPVTRKRTQSNASAKSTDENVPEDRKTKTPEVRKIITRRVSREMSGKDDSILEEPLTPKRNTRSKSKFNDNDSVISDSSVVSNKSKASEEGERASVRKGRKSVVASKPELSVIPEVTSEDKTSDNIISEYASSRRLTRHQKSVLESWLEPVPSPRRSTSRLSKHSASEDDDVATTHEAFDVQPIDRISLLNKTDFDGSPDADELRSNLSSDSMVSDASKQRKFTRAASESKSTPKAAKIHRRISVDVATESPDTSRGRRASFTRACEALNTPKGRRTSTDLRKGDTDSPEESVSSSIAGRRTRRAASTHSNSSVTSSDLGKRSKKAVDESKDSKKK